MGKDWLKFEKKWILNFAANIDESFINEHVYDGGFVWHVFSFEKMDSSKYLSGIEANKRYDEINKDNTYIYFHFTNKEIKMNRKYNSSKKLSKYDEIYVYSMDFSWCYIKTHEEDFGPYFIEVGYEKK